MTNGIVIGLSLLAGVWMGWFAVPICISSLAVIRLVERNRHLGIFVVCLVCISVGAVRSGSPPMVTSVPELGLSTGSVGIVGGFPRPSGEGHRVVVQVTELCVGDQCIPAELRVLVYFPTQDPPLSKGQKLKLGWRIETLQELPTGYRTFVGSQGAEGSARSTSVRLLEPGLGIFQQIAQMNHTLTARLEAALPGDTGALATGVVTGDDTGLAESTRANFRMTGTSHITAVSGQNVTLIIGFISLWFRPKRPGTRILFHTLLFVAVWSFTVLVGMESPAVRAAIVASLSIIGSHVGRRPDPVTLLSLTLGVIALLQPLAVHSVGFWLSATASMALCLALPNKVEKANRRSLMRIGLGPIIASVATMPIVLSSFGVWSPIGILANILIAPVMTLAFPLTYGFALFILVVPGLAPVLSWIPAIPLEFALVIVNRLAPVATQIRVDTVSPAMLAVLWTPIAIGIWLLSDESTRWIRRILTQMSVEKSVT